MPAASAFGAEQLALARGLADLTLDEGRAVIAGLRPPVLDDLGLADGLASLAAPSRSSRCGWTWRSATCPSMRR